MSNVITIMRKEFARFFYDRRMIIMVILPAILIYVVYSFMGTALQSAFAPDEDEMLLIYVVDYPASIEAVIEGTDIGIVRANPDQVSDIKSLITDQSIHLLIVFPPDFDAAVAAYDVQTAGGAPAPNIEIYYNTVVPSSHSAYLQMQAILDYYEASLANKFDINRDIYDFDLSTQEDRSAMLISTLLPMLLMIFLYSGCMGLALESITGEKERGTLATLLVSPLKRSQLAIGKILSLAILSFISGIVSAIATILALPNLMAGSGDTFDAVGIYSITDYALLAIIILSTLLLLVAMISIISAFAKTVKEASSASMPLMIVVMLVGVSGMFGGGAQEDSLLYFIPLYGNVQSMIGIFSMSYSVTNIVISCSATIVYACIGGFVLTKMFNSEKIMFSR